MEGVGERGKNQDRILGSVSYIDLRKMSQVFLRF